MYIQPTQSSTSLPRLSARGHPYYWPWDDWGDSNKNQNQNNQNQAVKQDMNTHISVNPGGSSGRSKAAASDSNFMHLLTFGFIGAILLFVMFLGWQSSKKEEEEKDGNEGGDDKKDEEAPASADVSSKTKPRHDPAEVEAEMAAWQSKLYWA
ncbi:hypothetical protein FPOA_09152 [Fusarium poae]|uniref:Transmembrane protein n=1 Tax=Fusarium poae TaxID=36050 RepID=A0A1B8AQN1_FUSPO|nr:hypothetical protein FPOA_09152 [Fusarium poae]